MVAQRLKVHTALIEEPNSGPRIYIEWLLTTCNSISDAYDFTGTYTTGTHSPPTHTNNLKF